MIVSNYFLHRKIKALLASRVGRKTTFTSFEKAKSLNAWGFPNGASLRAASALKADILIDLSSARSLPLIYVELLNPSLLKVGPKWSDESEYDFTIDVPKGKDASSMLDCVILYGKQFGK